MLLAKLCFKIYFWPFLAYLANIKGLCPFFPTGYYPPIITIPPVLTLPTFPTVPTFQPTPPTLLPTLVPCPSVPLVCLAGGTRPISYCPCIDPRNQYLNPLRLAGPTPTINIGAEVMVFSPLADRPRLRRRRRRHTGHPIDNNILTKLTISAPSVAQNCVDSRQRSGNCVVLASCPQLVEEYYAETKAMTNNVDFQTYVSNSFCGFDGSNFLICCRSVNSQFSQSSLSTQRAPVTSISFQSFQSLPTGQQVPSGQGQFPTGQLPAFPLQTSTSSNSVYQLQFASLAALGTGSLPVPTNVGGSGGGFSGVGGVAGGGVILPSSNSYPPSTATQNTIPSPVIFQPSVPVVGLPTIQPNPLQTPTRYKPQQQQQPQVGGNTATSGLGSCGISRGTTNRVVGGLEAKRGAYPWIAALGYQSETDRTGLKYLCSGSLIANSFVVTSAHCVNPTLKVIRLGAHDLTNTAEVNARNFGIKRTIVHQGFNMQSIANDIAIIELSSPAPSTANIGPICLPEGNNYVVQDFVGMHPFIAGWGAAQHQGPTSNVLRDAQVPIVSRQICEQNYKTIFQFIEFSDKLICAGNSNVDACQGDSGGPLMLPQSDSTGTYRYVLLGLVSYGYECARPGFPGVYTKVAAYLPWIKGNIITY